MCICIYSISVMFTYLHVMKAVIRHVQSVTVFSLLLSILGLRFGWKQFFLSFYTLMYSFLQSLVRYRKIFYWLHNVLVWTFLHAFLHLHCDHCRFRRSVFLLPPYVKGLEDRKDELKNPIFWIIMRSRAEVAWWCLEIYYSLETGRCLQLELPLIWKNKLTFSPFCSGGNEVLSEEH